MQAWADYLDKLKKGADVLQFKTCDAGTGHGRRRWCVR